MDEIIVYNTPFDCTNKCSGCYLKKTINLQDVDISKGVTNLCKRLSGSWEGRGGIETQSKKATLIIAVTNNRLSWSHVKFILKKTRHLRKFRETHIQVNITGLNISNLMDSIEDDPIDEISVSCTPTNYTQATRIGAPLKKEYGFRKTSTILTFEENEVEKLETAVDQLTKAFDTVYVEPIIDEEEVTTLKRSALAMPHLTNLIKNIPEERQYNMVFSPCIHCMKTKQCPVSPDTYVEITGNVTVKGCPYKLYKECKYGVQSKPLPIGTETDISR